MSSQYNKKKKKTAEEREIEIQSAKFFGKHVSEEKGKLLFAATMLACAAPMLLGARLWAQIPEIVPSGLIGMDGKDDSIPRWMVACGLPGLMCLLNFICHMQLLINQKRMTLPAAHVRLVGRWGFPILSVIFCSGMILQSTGSKALPLTFVTPCVLGLVLMMLGGHMFDCPRNAKLALRFSFTENNDGSWKAVHRFAGWCWLAVGLLVIAGVMLTATSSLVTPVLVLIGLLAPMAYGYARGSRLN